MAAVNGPILPDGSPPPAGLAAAVLALFDPMGIKHGAYRRGDFARHLATVTKVAPAPEHVEAIISELVTSGLIALRGGPRTDPSLGLDDGPGGDDECFVTTPLGKKAARLCKWIADPSGEVAGSATKGSGLDDIIIEAIGEGAHTLEVIDVACCCAATEDVQQAMSELVARGFIKEDRWRGIVLLPAGVARHAQLRDARHEGLASDLLGALGASLFSPPPGVEGRDGRAMAFDVRQLHPEIVATCRTLFVDGHHADAVLNGCKRIAHLVQARAASSLDGDALFAHAFKPDGGTLKFNSLSTSDDRNEQRGMMFLFQGMWAAVRNPNAHRFLTLDHTSALEHLGLLSLLLRYLDAARP